jgi:hypothetical protein
MKLDCAGISLDGRLGRVQSFGTIKQTPFEYQIVRSNLKKEAKNHSQTVDTFIRSKQNLAVLQAL